MPVCVQPVTLTHRNWTEKTPFLFLGKINFSVIILLLFSSLQAGIWWLRLPEGPWGRRSARGTAGDFSSTTQLQNPFCWQTISWLALSKEWAVCQGAAMKGWMGAVLVILSAASTLHIFYDELGRVLCFTKSPYPVQSNRRCWELSEPYLPFHLHKQPPVSRIWSHAVDEARLISQKIVFILQFDQFSSWVKSTQ